MTESRLAGVATWVLRPGATSTDVLLLREPAEADPPGPQRPWGPVRGEVGGEETEADAALRSLEAATGLADRRVYASPVAVFAPGPGLERVGVFVAIVPAEAEPVTGRPAEEHAWVPVREASARLADPTDRAALAEVDARFVRRAPDEALRVG